MSLKIYTQTTGPKVVTRLFETRVGEAIGRLEDQEPRNLYSNLKGARESGVRYALVGVPEDIGPRANGGRGGADGAWNAFLSRFLTMQSNEYFLGGDVLLLGHVEVNDLLEASRRLDPKKDEDLKALRAMCAEVDKRVYPVVHEIAKAGLKPVVMGGGHNLAYPVIRGTSTGLVERGVLSENGITTLNVDAHLDFRPLEDGRHSGNGYRYAFKEGYLRAYFSLPVEEAYATNTMLRDVKEQRERIGFKTLNDIVRGKTTLEGEVETALEFLESFGLPVGLEVDLDAIAGMPSSAISPCGITTDQARKIVSSVARRVDVPYLNLTEGAPSPYVEWGNPIFYPDGELNVGKALGLLVWEFVTADRERAAAV